MAEACPRGRPGSRVRAWGIGGPQIGRGSRGTRLSEGVDTPISETRPGPSFPT
jgi:hypothetical protein